MKKLLFLLLLVPSPLLAQTQVTVTGSINGATSGYVQFQLSPWSPSIHYYVAGPSGTTIANQSQICGINSGGALLNATLSGACLIWGNDQISPGNTSYTVVFAPGGIITNRVAQENITGATYNINSPVFAPPTRVVPQYQTITTAPIAANLVPATAHQFNVGSAGIPYAAGYFDNLVTNQFSINTLSLGTLNVNTINPKNNNNVRKCDQFSGADAGAKIVACIADLPSTGGTADARGLEGAQTVTVNIFNGVTKPVTLLLGAATFSASAAQTFGASNLRVVGLGPGTIWQYSGAATTYIWGDGGNTSTLYFQNELSGIKILGSANVTDGLHINSMHHSVFRNLSIGNVTGACFWIGFAVSNEYDNPHCTNNDMPGGVFSTTPVNGMLFQGLDSTNYATASPITNPIIESVSGSGIKLRYSQTLSFISGTSESNDINIETVAGGANQVDKFDTIHLEAPTTRHILSESCSECTWTNMFMTDTASKGARFTAGVANVISGGLWTNLTITNGAIATELHNVFYATNGATCGGLTDNGVGTLTYRLVKYDCTAVTFTPYAKIGVVDDFDLLNQQGSPTTAYLRNGAAQAGADLLQCTDTARTGTNATIYCRIFFNGGYRAGRTDQGNVALQVGNATNQGYVEFLINGTRYGYIGNGTSSSLPITLENGAVLNINGGLTSANDGLSVVGAGVVVGGASGGDKGVGTTNIVGPYYINGVAGATLSLSCPGGQAVKTLDVQGGLVVAASCGAP